MASTWSPLLSSCMMRDWAARPEEVAMAVCVCVCGGGGGGGGVQELANLDVARYGGGYT